MASRPGTAISEEDLRRLFRNLEAEKEKITTQIVTVLSYVGETAVKLARQDHTGNWNDITGNLRSSVGYAIFVDGKEAQVTGNAIVQTGGPEGDGSEGVSAARNLLETLRQRHPDGIVLVIVAGMRYAEYVENVRHKVVLSQAKLEAEQLARRMLGSLRALQESNP